SAARLMCRYRLHPPYGSGLMEPKLISKLERVERAAILRAPTDADGGARLQVGHALRIRHLDHEVGMAQHLDPRARVDAENDQLPAPRVEQVGAGAVARVDAPPLGPQRQRSLGPDIADANGQGLDLARLADLHPAMAAVEFGDHAAQAVVFADELRDE